MKYLAIDYGLKRIGTAVCDPGENIVSPLCQLTVNGVTDTLLERLKDIARQNQIEAVVVGLPLNMDDSEGEQARITRRFATRLEKVLSLPVFLQDERLSSAAAEEKLLRAGLKPSQRQAKRDMLAACEILQDFLDTKPDGQDNP